MSDQERGVTLIFDSGSAPHHARRSDATSTGQDAMRPLSIKLELVTQIRAAEPPRIDWSQGLCTLVQEQRGESGRNVCPCRGRACGSHYRYGRGTRLLVSATTLALVRRMVMAVVCELALLVSAMALVMQTRLVMLMNQLAH
jgi:hypothetical protein